MNKYTNNSFSDMAYSELKFSKEEINAAAKVLLSARRTGQKPLDSADEYWHALYVVNNFRSAHAYPLNTFQVGLRNNCRRAGQDQLVAQRIKRLASVYRKLDQRPTMKLTQVQDVGGCRAILNQASDVIDLHQYYVKKSAIKHELSSVDDYIYLPKESGYRGVHLVYRYVSDKNTPWNGLKVELQLRSKFQHAWATTVETIDMFSGQALKSSLGTPDWQRFFALMGGAIAARERKPPVPGLPTSPPELLAELQHLAQQLRVADRLRGYRTAVQSLNQAGAHYFLLQLDPAERVLRVTGFAAKQLQEALERYASAEEEARDHPDTDAVLVSVTSLRALKRAYPNYFADTRRFEALLEQTITRESRPLRAAHVGVSVAHRV